MTLFIAGLALFFAVHLVPAAPALRARWVAAAGEARYRRQFALLSLAGLALIIVGYAVAPRGAQAVCRFAAGAVDRAARDDGELHPARRRQHEDAPGRD